jgi:acetylxylan esterase
MNRHQHRILLAVASIALGLLLAAPAQAASLVQVARATWGAPAAPSYVQMYIYVPDTLAAKPPIMVSSHSCGSTATGQIGNIPKIKAAADANGFILILPDNPGQNCWDVGSAQSLKHDGGGDTQAVVQMVKYALTKYNGDAARVYAMGGSSGAMMTQALMAVYPDVFRAGSARAGVAAGCWADGYATSNQWSNNCAGGNTTKTAQQWGDLVRNMFPGYTGHRPRVQLMQGTADTTIVYKNTAESVKEWTNVLGLSTTPTSTDSGYKPAGSTYSYNREFWKNACGYTVLEAWSSPNGTHSMPYEETDILKFFGLDTAGGSDPEPNCTGDGGVGGTSGSAGAGGTAGAGGAGGGGARDGGLDAGSDAAGIAGRGGAQASAGSSGSSGAVGTGGGPGAAGVGGTGAAGSGAAGTGGGAAGSSGAAGTGGSMASGGRGGSGSGVSGSGGAPPQGGASGGGSAGMGGDDPSTGCGGCVIASDAGHPAPALAALLAVAVGLASRRRRGRR